MISKLEAVNTLLESIKDTPVNTLSGTLSTEAATAKNTLDETIHTVLAMGWAFNTDKRVTLTADNDGHITLPSDTLKVEINTDVEKQSRRYVLRGLRVYDRFTQSYEITSPLIAWTIVKLLDWDEIPESGQQYIKYRAVRLFQDRILGAKDGERLVSAEEARALLTLKQEHSEQERYNMLESPGIAEVAFRNPGSSHTWA